jgi:hypothetical protein
MGEVGVISHLPALSLKEARGLAQATEEAGADWLGLPDAFWWRDAWLLVAEAARATEVLTVGPVVTNPYLRHNFHTVAAVATLQELAGPRIFVGIGAGGSEVSGSAGISRQDAPVRIRSFIALLRDVAAGQPLDPTSGRTLDVPLIRPSVLVAGRANRTLQVAGEVADRALLWAVPQSDLERSAAKVTAGARDGRELADGGPEIVWAPLVDYGDADSRLVRSSLGYAVLNSSVELRSRWGVDTALVTEIRRRLLGGHTVDAGLLPNAAVDDLLFSDPDPTAVAAVGRRIGATAIAVPAFSSTGLSEKVAWARTVLGGLVTD